MAGRNEAKVRFTAETRDLTEKIRGANKELAAFRAGLKLNDAELKNNGNSTEYLKNKQVLLQAELQANAQKQEALTGKLEAAKRIYGEGSAEVQDWTTKLTNAKTEQQNLESQLKQCTQELEDQARAEERAKSPLEQLNTKIEEQKADLERLKTEYKNVALEQGTESKEAQELKAKIDQLNGELDENESKLKDVNSALEEAGEEADRSAHGGWSVLNQVIADLASNAINAAINKLQDFARETMELGIDFSSSMSNVQAISGATADQMEALEQTARDLGATTTFSASDVSDAFGYMAMAGWDTEQMLGGVRGVLDLAAASGEDLATTSDIVTDALTAFGMSAEDSGRFADILAAASSNANTNVSMLGESFKYVAPVAGAMGYSAEDTSIALSLMANAGIKASQGGTALRNVLTNMAKPSKDAATAMDALGISLTDDEGNMLSLQDVMGNLRESFGGLMISQEEFSETLATMDKNLEDGTITQKEYDKELELLTERAFGAEGAEKARYATMIAGKNGMSGLLAILNASEEDYSKLTESIYGCSGAAGEMAAVMNDNLGGDIKEMNSALEELKLKIFDGIQQPMRDIVQFITGSVIPAATQVLQFLQEHSVAIGVLAGVIGVIVTAIGLMTAVQAVQAAMNAAEAASLGALIAAKVASAAASWAALAPYILIVAAIAAVIAIIILCVKHWDEIKAKLIEVANAIKTTVLTAWENLKTKVGSIMDNIKTTISNIWGNIKAAVSGAVDAVKTKVSDVFNSVKETVASIWEKIKEHIVEPIQKAYSDVTQKIGDLKSKISEKISDIKSKVQETFDSIKEKMTSPIETAKETISGVIETIKGWFPISIGNIFTNLKLPHFSISGSFSLDPPSIPHVKVDWWASGAVFNAPTLIPTINGVHGVGEAGPEAVSPVSVLQDYVTAAVQAAVPQIDYDRLAEKVAAACAKMNININVDKRQIGRVVREVQA